MTRRRRHYSRVRAQSLVAHVHLDGKLVGGGAVENISAGGVLVRTAQQLPSGAAVQLDLVRPGMKKPFRLAGWVVGLSGTPPAVRIRFDLSADLMASRLHALLHELGLRELEEPPGAPVTPPLPPAARPPVLVPVLGGPAALPAAPGGEPSLQQQVRALQEELRQARAQLERHERELLSLRAELRVGRPA